MKQVEQYPCHNLTLTYSQLRPLPYSISTLTNPSTHPPSKILPSQPLLAPPPLSPPPSTPSIPPTPPGLYVVDEANIESHGFQLLGQAIAWPSFQVSQSIHQSINRSINRSVNQSINPSVNQSIIQSTNRLIIQSINRSIHQSINQSVNRSIDQSINQSINRSINQSKNQPLVYPYIIYTLTYPIHI